MVSGSNLNDLKTLLDATKGQDIDVYTNGNLLIAHAYEFFRNYKNLKGHFGSGVFNTILDFATFPGAILLTRNETQNIEYLYRGRLFTTDKISAKGVVKIENNDFLPLINSALQAKGFAKGQNRQDEIIGFNKIKLQNELDNIIKKNPRKIFIIAPSSISVDKIEYFKSLFNLASADNYIISFSYKPNCKNSLYINIGNNYALLLNILQIIFEKIPLNSKKFVFFMTKCDVNSLSNIINLKNNGAEEIFLSECPPFVINPAVLKSFVKLYNINEITTPKNDIDKILR
jgi:hydroxylamine reductase